jgi:hypothetical protein
LCVFHQFHAGDEHNQGKRFSGCRISETETSPETPETEKSEKSEKTETGSKTETSTKTTAFIKSRFF